MIIRNKFNGYSADGTRLYPGGGGGGPNTTYSNTSNIPEYARPYVEQMLGATQRQLFTGTNDAQGNFVPTGFNNFTPYGATYQRNPNTGEALRDSRGNVLYTNTAQQQAQAAVAPVSAGQQMATNSINQYVAPTQTQGATSIAGDIAGRSAASGYYSPLRAERFQLGAPQQVRTDSFTAPGISQAYMSPYMQNVVNAQQREARRAGDIQRMQNQAQATQQGAYGGSRQAIVEAERQRNLATQLGDIQAQGLQGAYQQGMGQFNAEQNAYLQAQQANQGANLNVATQNLQAQQAAQAAQEASRQFGAQLGLQGYGQSLQAAQTMAQLGQQQYQQDMSTIQAMSQLGAQEQAQMQNVINQELQNYGTAQQYPLMQLGVMSNMLRGLPMQASTTNMYQAQPSAFNQAAGMVGTGLALAKDYKALGREGGAVTKNNIVKMASGGIATGVSAGELSAKLKGPRFDDKALQQKAGDPQTDQATKDLVTAEMARRANLRAGMARGGIVAFKDGEGVEDEDKKRVISRGIERAKEIKRLKEDAKSEENFDDDMQVRAEKERRDERIRRDLNPPVAAAPVDNARIVAAAGKNVSPVPAAPAPAQDVSSSPPPLALAPTPVDAGALPPGTMNSTRLATALGRDQASPATKADAAISEKDYGSLPKELADELKDSDEQRAAAKLTMESTPQAVMKKREEELAALGLPSFYSKEQEKVRQKRLANKEQAKSDAEDRLHKFLINWGRTPGSTLRGIVEAGYDLSNQQGMDKKEQRRMEKELDEVSSSLDKAEYERKIGDYEKAKETITKAGELYYKIGKDRTKIITDYKIKSMESADKLEIARLKAEKAANKAVDLQVIDRIFETLIGEGKPATAQTYHAAIDEYYKQLKPTGQLGAAVIAQSFKPQEINLKELSLELERYRAKEAADKTAAETESKIQDLISSAKRAKRDALDDAETKGYKGQKGAAGKALLESEIEAEVRRRAASKSTVPKGKTSGGSSVAVPAGFVAD
jgi:hypothetical protein